MDRLGIGGAGGQDDSHLVSETLFVAFDLETSGLFPTYDRIIEIGAVKFQEGRQMETFQSLVNPGPDISVNSKTVHINGISDEMLQGAPTIDAILPKFHRFIDGAVLLAHNATFDIGFLRAAYREIDLPDVRNPLVDTIQLAKKSHPKQKSYALQELVDALKIEQGTAHRALDDAIMCMHLFFISVSALSFMGALPLKDVLVR